MAKKFHPNKKIRCAPGEKIGEYTLVKRVRKPKGFHGDIWQAVCSCGKEETIREQYFFREPNPKRSCGHERKGIPTQYPREYSSWAAMHGRCYRTDHVSYKDYGGRGITVCPQWHNSGPHGFWQFLQDMGPRPDGCSLDRYPDPNGNYEPGNCRWATTTQQAWNKREHVGPKPLLPDISDIIEESE